MAIPVAENRAGQASVVCGACKQKTSRKLLQPAY